jgi:hypothetical protein
MRPFFTLLLLLFFLAAGGQENRLSFHLNPVPLIYQQDGPSYQVGFESRLYHNISFSAAYGGYIRVGNSKWWMKENINGFLLRPEIKVYLNNEEHNDGAYLSLDCIYKKQDFRYWVQYVSDTLGETHDCYVQKKSCAFNLKYGKVLLSGEHFLFEWYAGAGLNFVSCHDDLTAYQHSQENHGEGSGGLYSSYIRSDQRVQPSITLGIKLGFCAL